MDDVRYGLADIATGWTSEIPKGMYDATCGPKTLVPIGPYGDWIPLGFYQVGWWHAKLDPAMTNWLRHHRMIYRLGLQLVQHNAIPELYHHHLKITVRNHQDMALWKLTWL